MRKVKRFALKRKVLFIRALAVILPVLVALLVLSQTALAETTYVITDGSWVYTYTTTETEPGAVLGEAGLELGENDTYTTQREDGRSEITVQRANDVTVYYHGQKVEASSRAETVSQLLSRLNLTLEKHDTVSCDLEDMVTDGLVIRIEQKQVLQQVYTTDIPHQVTYCYDSSLPQGVEQVLVEGVDGQMLCTASVTYVNGQEAERIILRQDMISQSVTEIIAVGCGKELKPVDPNAMPIFGDGTITLPTGEVLTYTGTLQVKATAYAVHGTTATGTRSRVGAIAVDPKVIPYGTRMFIVSNDGQIVYGIATAEDCGDPNYIGGKRVDLFYDTIWECNQFGIRECTVYFLGTE